MTSAKTWGAVGGLILHVLIGGLLILSGGSKALGLAPSWLFEQLNGYGLGRQAALIGWGEALAGLLLIVPATMPLGALAASSFWGGVLCILMAHNEDYTFSALVLLLTWLGAGLRRPEFLPGLARAARPASRPAFAPPE
jgi:hypothetical protein